MCWTAKGTQDVLPAASYKNRFLENTLLDIASRFGFKEIRTPVFEHTELFARGVGDTTDVVQKEMYTFLDKGGRSITLRPEGCVFLRRRSPAPQPPDQLTHHLHQHAEPEHCRCQPDQQHKGIKPGDAAQPAHPQKLDAGQGNHATNRRQQWNL